MEGGSGMASRWKIPWVTEKLQEQVARIQAQLSADVSREMQHHFAHLDSHLADRIMRETARKLDQLSSELSKALHASLAHVDAHLSDQLGQVHSHLTEHLTREIARNAGELNSGLSAAIHTNLVHVDSHLSDQLAQVNSHLAEHLTREVARNADQLNTGLAAALHSTLAHLDAHLSDHLTRELSLHLSGEARHGRDVNSVTLQSRMVELGRYLRPRSAVGHAKRRVGREGDGGYVMLDDLQRAGAAISFGVGQEVTWDLELADLGLEVHQFDHTIDAPPAEHPRVQFHRRKVVPVAEDSGVSLAQAVALAGPECLVKMDIEGDEWPVIAAASEADLGMAAQLVCEFHDFHRAHDDSWYACAMACLTKLNAVFDLVHVHANNYGRLLCAGNVPFPEILEVTFVNKRIYPTCETSELFPTRLDAPNRPDLPDIILGSFRF